MNTYYVATLAKYVLVDAVNEHAARIAGETALKSLHAEVSARIGREFPVQIRTVRLATSDEIDFHRWNEETLAREAKN